MTAPQNVSDPPAPSEPGRTQQPLSPRAYLGVSAVGLLFAAGLLVFLVFGADRIMASGLDHRVFYVLLVPLGLAAAAFAFGAMNSTGTFTQQGSRQVGLTGPAMFAALVVVGGFFMVPQGGLRNLVVRVDRAEESGGGPVAGAAVTVDWGVQRLTQVTDATGQASFVGLPPGASGVAIAVEAAGYAARRQVLESVPADGAVRVDLAVKASVTRLRGTVFDRRTGVPLEGVALNFGSGAAVDTTDALGNFAVELAMSPGARILVTGTRGGTRGLNTEVTVADATPVQLEFGGG